MKIYLDPILLLDHNSVEFDLHFYPRSLKDEQSLLQKISDVSFLLIDIQVYLKAPQLGVQIYFFQV